MSKDKKTSHQRVIDAARQEFLELGYEKASMRSIGKKAGMTQAALYRHFESKEDMFAKIVEPGINALNKCLEKHEKNSYAFFEDNIKDIESISNYNVKIFRNLLYHYRDEFILIFRCSRGTRFVNFLSIIVEKLKKSTFEAMDYLKSKGYKVKDVSDDELSLFLRMYLTAITEPIAKGYTREKAMHLYHMAEAFFTPGWLALLGL